MGVYIKGMEMPKDCNACFLDLYDRQTYCRNGKKTLCPLIEVETPHGRLVDADDLIIGLELHAEAHPSDSIVRIEVETTIGAITNEPTVIEAEESE